MKPETAVVAEIVPVEANAIELGTLKASSPAEVIEKATEMATPLAKLIQDRKLYTDIRGKRHVRCEGWTTLAAMLGVTPHEVSVTEPQEGVFVATVELRRMSDGAAIGRASAECGASDEPLWSDRPRYARRSMALTRATAKTCRLTFSWIMVLAGYDATPAEEIPSDDTPSNGAPKSAVPLDCIPFGNQRGDPIVGCSTEHLESMRDWCQKHDAFPGHAAVMTQLLAKRAAKVEPEPEEEGHDGD